MSLPQLALVTLAIFAGATLGTALMRRLAGRYGWMVLPRADRWHKQPTARHGGCGVCLQVVRTIGIWQQPCCWDRW